MAPHDDLTAERAAISLLLNRLNGYDGACITDIAQEKDIDLILQRDKQTRQEALREAARVCRSNTYMSKDALDGGAFGGPGSCEYGCGDVIANELDRLASEGG